MEGKTPLTVSIGVSNYTTDDTTRHGLIEKADKALYRAKSTGKNKVVEFSKMKKADVD